MSKKIELIMGMPVIIQIVDKTNETAFKKVFDYFKYIDEKFSPYKAQSEVTKINDKRIKKKNASEEMKLILKLSKKTKEETDGYFDIYNGKFFDPSGIVKGWAIYNASKILDKLGYKNYCIEAGGDIQTKGLNYDNKKWAIGIRNPFNLNEIVKIVYLSGEGVATSGIYERGNHIYNPIGNVINEVVCLTVVGKNIYEADRFATAAFAMGEKGINFIEKNNFLEGYMIKSNGIATMTRGFEKYANI